jgi:hypothetical protein
VHVHRVPEEFQIYKLLPNVRSAVGLEVGERGIKIVKYIPTFPYFMKQFESLHA